MKTNTTAKVILFPQQTKKGFPLKIRIIQNRKSQYIGLKYYLTESQKLKFWNEVKGELRKSYTYYNQVMIDFDNELMKLGIELKKEIETTQEPITINPSFTQFYKNYMTGLNVKSQFGLLQKTNSVFKHLETFCKESKRPTDILFNQLDIDFLKDFQFYLIDKKLLSITQRGYIEKIRGIVNQAIKENKFNPVRHPFLGFEFMRVDSKPKCLEPQQFNLVKSITLGTTIIINTKTNTKHPSMSSKIKKTGLMFLFQYFTYGMRVSDLLQLKWENMYESGKRLKYLMFKTKNYMDIVLSNDLLDILFEFMDFETRKKIYIQSNEPDGKFKFNVEGISITINKKNEWYDLIRSNLYFLSVNPEKKSNHIFPLFPDNLILDRKLLFSKISTYTSVYQCRLVNVLL